MNSLEFRIQVNPRPQGVELTVISPDAEVQTLGVVSEPAHLPALMTQVSAYLALELLNAVWEVRSGM